MIKFLIFFLISCSSFANTFHNEKEECITIIKQCSLDKTAQCSVKYCGENIFKYKLQNIIEKQFLIGKRIDNILDFESNFRKVIGSDFNSFNIQILSEHAPVTMDYNNRRIRIFISNDQKIKQIKIG